MPDPKMYPAGSQYIPASDVEAVPTGTDLIETYNGNERKATSVANLAPAMLCLDIADGSADATYYLVCPFAGTIKKIWTVVDGVVGTADITITAKIGSTGITNGVVTIATASSAAGDVDSATPTAANTVTAGQAINFVVAGGGSGGSPRIHLVVELQRA